MILADATGPLFDRTKGSGSSERACERISVTAPARSADRAQRGSAMSQLQDVLASHVDDGSVPGAVGLVARGDRVEVGAVGSVDVDGHRADGQGLDLPHRLDHQAHRRRGRHDADRGRPDRTGGPGRRSGCRSWRRRPSCARRTAPVDDVVPAVRPITVSDLLTSRAGYGFPSDFSLPAVGRCSAS